MRKNPPYFTASRRVGKKNFVAGPAMPRLPTASDDIPDVRRPFEA
jgi:hypothetical protein